MRIEFSIDWLAFTQPLTLLPSPSLYAPVARNSGNWYVDRPHNGYKTAYRNQHGVLCQWNDERPEMRVHTQYSGETLTRCQDAGLSPMQIVQCHAIHDDWRLTRIDLAFDLYNSPVDIEGLYKEITKGNIKMSTTKANLLKGADGGQTLYIGSRQSDKFIRIYDKAVEQSLPGNWIRIELEIKGETAREIGKRLPLLVGAQLSGIAKELLWNMVQFKDKTYQHLCSEKTPIDFTISHKKSDNLKSWLADQVAPAIADYLLKGGDNDIIDQLTVLVSAAIRRKSRL